MALNDDIALLATVPLFADFSEDKLRLIAFGAERRRVPAGQTLFRQGATADGAYVVVSGRLDLSESDRHGATKKIGAAEKGALLGELALISPVKRKMTAVAAEASEVIRITRPLFTRMLEEYPEIADMIGSRIASNLGALIADVGRLAPRLR